MSGKCLHCLVIFQEKERERCGDEPSDGPCEPDTSSCSGQAGEDKGQNDAQDQVGEGGDHKGEHGAGTAEDAVCDQLGGYDEVKGGENLQELLSGGKGGAGALV